MSLSDAIRARRQAAEKNKSKDTLPSERLKRDGWTKYVLIGEGRLNGERVSTCRCALGTLFDDPSHFVVQEDAYSALITHARDVYGDERIDRLVAEARKRLIARRAMVSTEQELEYLDAMMTPANWVAGWNDHLFTTGEEVLRVLESCGL